MNDKITGIILAGGRSSRMGEDKSLMLFSGKRLIEIAINKLSSLFANLIIITNKPHLYKEYGVRTEFDIIKDCGPLGGIYTGLLASDAIYNFIVACDMPFLNQDLIKYMIGQIEDYDIIVVEHNKKLEPLCAIYSKNCIERIGEQLRKNNFKIADLFSQVKVRKITEKEILAFDRDGKCFMNVNTKYDLERMKEMKGANLCQKQY